MKMAKAGEEVAVGFEDYLPVMAEKLGEEEFMGELCNGFRLLADAEKGVITLESLKKNVGPLGMEGMSEEEVGSMMESGDLNDDGVIDQNEFCILMIRLSPSIMAETHQCLQNALLSDLHSFFR